MTTQSVFLPGALWGIVHIHLAFHHGAKLSSLSQLQSHILEIVDFVHQLHVAEGSKSQTRQAHTACSHSHIIDLKIQWA